MNAQFAPSASRLRLRLGARQGKKWPTMRASLVLGILSLHMIAFLLVAPEWLSWRGSSLREHVSRNSSVPLPHPVFEDTNPEPRTKPEPATNPRIAIITTCDDKYAARFQWHTDSLRCYAAQQGYDYVRVPVRGMVKRHRVVLDYLHRANWTLFLDCDAMVVNFARRIEEYVDPQVHLVLIQRLINGEIAAGGYLIDNSDWSRAFLTEILEYRGAVVNSDNGVLLATIARRLAASVPGAEQRALAERCVAAFELGGAGYGRGKCCLWAIAGRQRRWPSLGFKVMRRGHGFMRDDWLAEGLMDSDFIVHHKGRWEGKFVDLASAPFKDARTGECKIIGGLVWPQFRKSGAKLRNLVCMKDVHFANSGPANYAPDVASCFPNCSQDALDAKHFVPSLHNCSQKRFQKPRYNPSICSALSSSLHSSSPAIISSRKVKQLCCRA